MNTPLTDSEHELILDTLRQFSRADLIDVIMDELSPEELKKFISDDYFAL